MIKRPFYLFVFIILNLSAFSQINTEVYSGLAKGLPNIIFIVLDDVGFSDLGCYGSEINTPHIDKLSANGLRYNHFETRAVCSATRASLLTGRNNQTVGIMDISSVVQEGIPYLRGFINDSTATIASILKEKGYLTSICGKWHLSPRSEWPSSSKIKSSWPREKGFDQFYGWISGWIDQYHPFGIDGKELIEGNDAVEVDSYTEEHVSVALVNKAIEYLKKGFHEYPNSPQFLYLSLGAAHSPHQVPKRYTDKYSGIYDKGWDEVRKLRFYRQKEIGIIPSHAILTPRDSTDVAWDELGSESQAVFSQFMANYAGFLTHTDEQIGRLIEYLKNVNQFDNSIVILLSDNGAAPEGGMTGGFYRPYGDTTSIYEMFKNISKLGSEESAPFYQRPWAWVGSTPFKSYKLFPYGGGVRDPLIISWPNRINDRGGIREQYVEVCDIVPTVLDVLNFDFPQEVNGVVQKGLHGKSFKQTLFQGDMSLEPRTQFFSLRGNRAVYHNGWKAIALHENGTSFEEDKWELYRVTNDFSEGFNVADRFPEKLMDMIKIWWDEAEKYGALPLKEFYMDRKYGGAIYK